MHRIDIFIFIHESGSNINNNNNNNRPNRKLNYKHLIKYYNVVAKLAETFTLEVYRNINLSCLLLRTHLDRFRSIATRVASSMVRVQSACLLCTPVALQKRLNRLSCRWGQTCVDAKNHVLDGGVHIGAICEYDRSRARRCYLMPNYFGHLL